MARTVSMKKLIKNFGVLFMSAGDAISSKNVMAERTSGNIAKLACPAM